MRFDRSRCDGGYLPNSGWRRAAYVNSAVLTAITILMACLLAVSASQTSFVQANLFFAGTCDGGTASAVNVGLHLVLNTVSTAVFASSNFFMQVLNAPSREEVDAAHAKGVYLGIGVPSVRNVFRVGRFKTYSWMALLLSSIPMHLFFNSMIFQTDYHSSGYHLTIADANFVNGAQYYAPGASLTPSGYLTIVNRSSRYLTEEYHEEYHTYEEPNMNSWGPNLWIGDYQDASSKVRQNISNAAANGASWDKITATECYNTYVACNGIGSHRNVIIVVNTTFSWVRDQLWHLNSTESDFWDVMVPKNDSNSLWFDAECLMVAAYGYSDGGVACRNSCGNALGFDLSIEQVEAAQKTSGDGWTYAFFRDINNINTGSINTYMTWVNESYGYTLDDGEIVGRWSSGFVPQSPDLTVDHCLVEPVHRLCHVGLSNTLLLTVTIFLMVKTITAIVVTIKLGQQEPIITLGDAIASFIQRPDSNTIGMCTASQAKTRQAMCKCRRESLSGPREWQDGAYRRWTVVPKAVWMSSYLLFTVSIGTAVGLFGLAYGPAGIHGSFFESDTNAIIDTVPWSFTTGVLTANSPQLLLSFCYLAFNNLFTRLQMAKEWSQFSSGFYPLRVTNPRGDQYSTYRLQLPYKYSIPLIISSIALHWMLSNTVYLFISEGGYYSIPYYYSITQDSSLPDDTFVIIGYSVWALLGLLVFCCVLICVPVFLSIAKLPGDTVNVGSNSIAISAACHVSQVYMPEEDRPGIQTHSEACGGDELEMSQINPDGSIAPLCTQYSAGEMTKEDWLRKISQSRIRWGVIRMPPGFYQEYDCTEPYEHLGFGVEGEEISPPQHGKLYA